MTFATKENLTIGTAIFCFFLLFLLSWIKDGGAWVFGLYSEVDGQFFAWTSKYLLLWGTPFDMNTLNPFGGMISIFTPVNSWWNPASLPLGLQSSKLINFALSYSIYWLEIFFAIYFLAKITGLNKIEALLAAEIFVLLVFPPFSAHYNSTPLYSLVPVFAHILALMCMLTVFYAHLGTGTIGRNLMFVALFVLTSFLVIMGGGLGFIPCIPIYALLLLGFTLHKFNKQKLLWQIGSVTLVFCLFFLAHCQLYYQGTVGYVAPALVAVKAIAFALPKTLQKHRSIFYGAPPLFSFLNIFALLGSLVGIFYRQGKYKWLAVSFVFIVLLPEVMGFFIENGIISGSISNIGIDYYVWDSYPVYCIAAVIFVSFLWQQLIKLTHFFTTRFSLEKLNPQSFSFGFLALFIPFIVPALAIHLWFGSMAKNATPLKEPSRTPIVAYLENQIALVPGGNFKGTTAAYFSSKNSPLRQINGPFYEKNLAEAAHFTEYDYIMSREFLNKRFYNRHMLTDLWNFNIPTLEEYGHWITAPMYVFFKQMLAAKGDNLNGNFLNVYKLDLNVMRALGTRFIISDKVLNYKELTLVTVQNQDFPSSMETTPYVDYKVAMSAKKAFDELLASEFKSDKVSGPDFTSSFMKKLETLHPSMQKDNAKIAGYLENAVTSALGDERRQSIWTHKELETVRNYYNSIIFTWVASPPLYLYEIKNPNLATFSPTQLIHAGSAGEIFRQMHKPEFSFEKAVVVQDDLPSNIAAHLESAKHSELRFERNTLRVKAESRGWSVLLLPLQYSHCFSLHEKKSPSAEASAARLIRANLIQSALVFKGKTEVKLDFNFGMGKDLNCRQQDIQDMKGLDLVSQFLA